MRGPSAARILVRTLTINKVATVELDLHRHLFGSNRIIPPKELRDGDPEPLRGLSHRQLLVVGGPRCASATIPQGCNGLGHV